MPAERERVVRARSNGNHTVPKQLAKRSGVELRLRRHVVAKLAVDIEPKRKDLAVAAKDERVSASSRHLRRGDR